MRNRNWMKIIGMIVACGILANCASRPTSPPADTSGGATPEGDIGHSDIGTSTEGAGGATTAEPTAQGLFPKGLVGFGSASISVAGVMRDVLIYIPANTGLNPPLVVIYHGTGTSPRYYMTEANLQPVADANGFIIVGGQAMSNRKGGPEDVDHWRVEDYPTGWNLIDENPATNEDIILTNRMIDEAIAAYHVDTKRVYAIGSSNGGFMSFFVAAALQTRFAAFAEGCGGAMYCANAGYNNGTQFVGKGTTCEALKLEAGYPKCTGQLEPLRFNQSARIPPGFLAHGNNDETVSVAWSCTLKEYMGTNAKIVIYPGGGHSSTLVFAPDAWNFLSTHTL